MNAHWHLIVNHLPVLGVPFGAGLLGIGLLFGRTTLQRAGLAVLVLAGLAAVGVALSREGLPFFATASAE